MPKVLGLVSAVLAALDMMAFYSLAKTIAFEVIAYDPLHQMDSAYRVRFLEQLGAIFAGLLCLCSISFLFHFYERARTRRALWTRVAWAISIQLAVIGLSYLLPVMLALP